MGAWERWQREHFDWKCSQVEDVAWHVEHTWSADMWSPRQNWHRGDRAVQWGEVCPGREHREQIITSRLWTKGVTVRGRPLNVSEADKAEENEVAVGKANRNEGGRSADGGTSHLEAAGSAPEVERTGLAAESSAKKDAEATGAERSAGPLMKRACGDVGSGSEA